MENVFNPPVAQVQEAFPAALQDNQNTAAAIAKDSSETYSSIMAAQVETNVKARYAMAIAHPRDLDLVRQRMLKDARRPSFASVAIYHKPVGNGVEGPSIRFVEAALRNFGNAYVETVVTFDNPEKRIVRVSVTDLETNTYYNQDVTIQKTVEKKSVKPGDTVLSQRVNSQGKITFTVPATDDDILNKTNALISKAVRTLGLRIIPGDITDEAIATARMTMRTQNAQDPDAAKRNIIDSFASLGITVDALKEYVGHTLDSITPAELAELRPVFTALRDGDTTWKELMDDRREKTIAEAKASAKKEEPKKEEPKAAK